MKDKANLHSIDGVQLTHQFSFQNTKNSKEVNMKKLLTVILLLLTVALYSQDYSDEYVEEEYLKDERVSNGGGTFGDCLIPHTQCWCDNHPNSNHPHCTGEEPPPQASAESDFFVGLAIVCIILYVFKIVFDKRHKT
ncbi:MAG TPA: hypothetical protein VF680_16975 [Allosphingosinicella sp.]